MFIQFTVVCILKPDCCQFYFKYPTKYCTSLPNSFLFIFAANLYSVGQSTMMGQSEFTTNSIGEKGNHSRRFPHRNRQFPLASADRLVRIIELLVIIDQKAVCSSSAYRVVAINNLHQHGRSQESFEAGGKLSIIFKNFLNKFENALF